MTFALSGYAVVRAMSQNFVDVMAWMPFLFAALELAARNRSRRWLGIGAAVFALQLLAGHPQAALYSAVAAFLYGLYRCLGMRGTGPGSGSGPASPTAVWTGAVAGTFALGAGMAAVQLLPTWELVQLSGRSEGLDYGQFAKMSLPPERLVCLLLPDFFGNSATGSYWGREAGFFIQLCPYVGVLPLLLAVLALRGNRNRHVPFLRRPRRRRPAALPGQVHRSLRNPLRAAGAELLQDPDAFPALVGVRRRGTCRSRPRPALQRRDTGGGGWVRCSQQPSSPPSLRA